MAVRTWARRGEAPVLEHTLTRDHLSVIGGVTPEGRLFTQIQEKAFDGEGVVAFLEHLIRRIQGKVTVVWDGATIHRGQAVKKFLSQGGARRIHLVRLPGYAPELNPAEGIWQTLKYMELRNVCCRNLPELKGELKKAIGRLRHKRELLQGYVRHLDHLAEQAWEGILDRVERMWKRADRTTIEQWMDGNDELLLDCDQGEDFVPRRHSDTASMPIIKVPLLDTS